MLAPVVGRFILTSSMAAAAALCLASCLLGVKAHAVEYQYSPAPEWIDRNPEASFALSPPEAAHFHSSTYQEGVLRGMAVLTRAEGDRNLLDAQAGILWEQVYAMRIRNFLYKGQAHYEWKEMMADSRHRARINDMLRTEELHRAKQLVESRRELEKALEYPLSEFDIDFRTGTIYWPAIVAGPRYARYRVELNDLMADIMRNGSFTSPSSRDRLIELCHNFRRQLQADLNADLGRDLAVVQAQYDAVQRLIKGLRYTPVVMAQASIDTFSMN
jgi:hypothetical protein